MIYELRTYDMKIGRLPAYLQHFEAVGHEILCRFAQPVGYWITETGRLNRVYHLWAYADRAARVERRAALYADSEWLSRFLPEALPNLARQASTLLSLEAGAPLEHPRYRAEGAPWLYEISEVSPGEIAADASTIAVFRPETGDLGRRIIFRAFSKETDWSANATSLQAERVVTEMLMPAPFSALR